MRKVSHELRGPLGTIQTALKTVLQGKAGDIAAGPHGLISRAERRVGDLAQVTQDLLALSRAKEAALASEMNEIDPGSLIASVVADTEIAAVKAEVAFRVELPPELGTLRADAQGLQELLSNLLGNAIRYTRRGGKVVLRVQKTSGVLRLQVEDTGIGIPQEDLNRIFEEFYRSGNAREHTTAGTGLGLAIVKAVVDRHGGSISVDSSTGQGTRFTVDIPLVPVGS
jgi:signal transduction histidine kinase